MDQTLYQAIEVLAKKVTPAARPDDALKFTQAALNLAHVKGILTAEAKDQQKKRASA